MSTVTFAEHHLLMKHQIDWDSVACKLCILQTTINVSL